MADAQDFTELVGLSCSLQRQSAMPQAHVVAQVQTGVQLQLQFWQPHEALDETVD